MTQLVLTSKDFFFFLLHAKTPFFFALKVLSKFYKLILARGFKETSASDDIVFFPRFSLCSCIFISLPLSWPNLGKTTQNKRGTRVSHLSFPSYQCITLRTQGPASFVSSSFVAEARRTSGEYKCKKKEGTRRGWRSAEVQSAGEGGEEMWKRRNKDVD